MTYSVYLTPGGLGLTFHADDIDLGHWIKELENSGGVLIDVWRLDEEERQAA